MALLRAPLFPTFASHIDKRTLVNQGKVDLGVKELWSYMKKIVSYTRPPCFIRMTSCVLSHMPKKIRVASFCLDHVCSLDPGLNQSNLDSKDVNSFFVIEEKKLRRYSSIDMTTSIQALILIVALI